jgi:hypothetical protein
MRVKQFLRERVAEDLHDLLLIHPGDPFTSLLFMTIRVAV